MRTQLCKLCLILEPKWFKLTTCDWIRRIVNEGTSIGNISAENGKYLTLLCLLCSIRVLLLVKTIWYCDTKPELTLLERLVYSNIILIGCQII